MTSLSDDALAHAAAASKIGSAAAGAATPVPEGLNAEGLNGENMEAMWEQYQVRDRSHPLHQTAPPTRYPSSSTPCNSKKQKHSQTTSSSRRQSVMTAKKKHDDEGVDIFPEPGFVTKTWLHPSAPMPTRHPTPEEGKSPLSRHSRFSPTQLRNAVVSFAIEGLLLVFLMGIPTAPDNVHAVGIVLSTMMAAQHFVF
jgi:hypothetical protein